jgi:signal transduction histidine kinase
LAQDDDSDEDLEQYITLSHEELKRAARIVSRLRDLSRPTDVDVGEPTDVNELIERVLKLSQKKLNNQGINVIRHLEEDLPRPVLAPDRMQQVFLNLMLNAIDVMSEGDRLEISTDHHEASDEIVVTFSDDGPGIPADALPHIFDPFFSTKSEGVGLGLFVSQNIVQRHGGRIDVENNIGKGCTFTVRLPM